MLPTKVEIKLRKAEPGSWSQLSIPRASQESPKTEETKESDHISDRVEAVDLSDLWSWIPQTIISFDHLLVTHQICRIIQNFVFCYQINFYSTKLLSFFLLASENTHKSTLFVGVQCGHQEIEKVLHLINDNKKCFFIEFRLSYSLHRHRRKKNRFGWNAEKNNANFRKFQGLVPIFSVDYIINKRIWHNHCDSLMENKSWYRIDFFLFLLPLCTYNSLGMNTRVRESMFLPTPPRYHNSWVDWGLK